MYAQTSMNVLKALTSVLKTASTIWAPTPAAVMLGTA